VAEEFDIIIVGSGAGGGTLAHTLARTGKRILILERGGFLPGGPGVTDPPQPPPADRHVPPETWYDAHGRPFQPDAHYFVGGATKVYGAALSRLRPIDFGSIAHMDGISPAWPFSYGDFEPWYDKAEWLYQVHGQHGEDPTEGSWSQEYPWPPVSHEPLVQHLADELTLAGYQPFHTPTGVLLDGALADADVIAVRPLLDRPNVTLLVDAQVKALQTDSRGRSVTGVVVSHGGAREIYRGDIVVLAAGAVNSARILLSSARDGHPGGLANRSGQVGRNLMCHNHFEVAAVVAESAHAVSRQTLGALGALGVNDFYLGGRQARWPLGSIQLVGDPDAAPQKRVTPGPAVVPRPRDSRHEAGRSVAFRLTTEDLPRPANRVSIDGQGRLRLAHVATGDGAARLLYRSLRAMLGGTRMISHEILGTPGKPPANRCADYAGTCRLGADPATSVLDLDCRAHELDNLYVVDASFFPSIGPDRDGQRHPGRRAPGRTARLLAVPGRDRTGGPVQTAARRALAALKYPPRYPPAPSARRALARS
jgi:choline dehydrogenase-like flavoprotein